MAIDTPRRRRPRRFPDDFLRAELLQHLADEFRQLGETNSPLWSLWQTPYPFDADTAQAVQGMLERYVLPWALVERYVEEWTYPGFARDAEAFREGLSEQANLDAWPEVPDLACLRCPPLPVKGRSPAGWWPQEFAQASASNLAMLRDGLLLDHPELAGRYLIVPYVPLGRTWACFVPLADGAWLDRRLIDLIEAAARLREQGVKLLPPLDGHRLAYHRLYSRHARFRSFDREWHDPQELPQARLLDAVVEASAAVQTLPGRRREIDARTFIHVEDYAEWGRRRLPDEYLAEDARHLGIDVRRWNSWIQQYGAGAWWNSSAWN